MPHGSQSKGSTWLHNIITLAYYFTNVGIEPTVQPLNGQVLNCRTANTEDNARLDIKAQNFWDNSRWNTFFDLMNTLHPTAPPQPTPATEDMSAKREGTMSSE